MRAARIGHSPRIDLPRRSAGCLFAAMFLALLLPSSLGFLSAQTPQSSAANPPPGQPHAQPKGAASQDGAASPDRARAPAPAQDPTLGQGDQSLQPDPLANPVDPPPTPEEPAADDSGAPAASLPDLPPEDFPGPSASSPAASGAQPAGALPTPIALPGSARPAVSASAVAARPAAFDPPPVPPPAKAADPHRQQINDQCANLLSLADALKMAVDKTTKDELSVTVVRKAGQIEQLARKVKNEMRPTLSRN